MIVDMKLLAERLVPDPMMTDAEFLYRKRQEHDRAERRGDRPRGDVGKVIAQERPVTRLGALAFIRRRQPHHELAAERFKNIYEGCYGVGSPAMDAGRVQVDTSPIAHDSGMAHKVDKLRVIRDAEDALGKPVFDRIVALVVLCVPAGEGAPLKPNGKPNERHVERLVDAALADLDALATLWKLRSAA